MPCKSCICWNLAYTYIIICKKHELMYYSMILAICTSIYMQMYRPVERPNVDIQCINMGYKYCWFTWTYAYICIWEGLFCFSYDKSTSNIVSVKTHIQIVAILFSFSLYIFENLKCWESLFDTSPAHSYSRHTKRAQYLEFLVRNQIGLRILDA